MPASRKGKKQVRARFTITRSAAAADFGEITIRMWTRGGKRVYFRYRLGAKRYTESYQPENGVGVVFPATARKFRIYVSAKRGYRPWGWTAMQLPPMPTKKPTPKPTPTPTPTPSPSESDDGGGVIIDEREPDTTPPAEFTAKVIADLNAAREQGAVCGGDKYEPMQTLKPHAALLSAAQEHADEMYNERWFSEVSPSGDWPMDRALSHGFRWTPESWENSDYPDAIVGLWLSPNEVPMLFNGTSGSPSAWWGTCRTLLDPDYNSVGVGVAGDWNNYTRWVTIYVGKEG